MYFMEFPVLVRPDLVAALRRAWDDLAAPGTWWDGHERVAIAAAGRGEATDRVPAAVAGAARTIYAEITTTSRAWVERLTGGDMSMAAFVEVVGLVSRLAAVDHFTRALGRPPEPLPQPVAGEPSREPPPATRPGRAWVPMVGPASITQALSLVPAESAAQREIHGPLYMSYEQMADFGFHRNLDRAQMELIAARASAINECFY